MSATLQSNAPTTLGQRLVAEIARRSQLGYFFNYAGYETLKELDTPALLRAFLARHGYRSIQTDADTASIVDQLQAIDATRAERYGNISCLLVAVLMLFMPGWTAVPDYITGPLVIVAVLALGWCCLKYSRCAGRHNPPKTPA